MKLRRRPVSSPRIGGGRRPSWSWQDHSACVWDDLLLFFGPDSEQAADRLRREKKAKKVCRRCTVAETCLAYALERPEKNGVWGGLGEDERAALRRKRQRAASVARSGLEVS